MSIALVIASHPDDEILGCGATMSRWAGDGSEIHILILGEGITSRSERRDPRAVERELEALKADVQRAAKVVGAASAEVLDLPDNRFDSIPLLDIVKRVEEKKRAVRPTVVLTHHGADLNVDHRCTLEAVMTACRPMPGETVQEILSFEVPSSTEWRAPLAANAFLPTQFVHVSSAHVEAKIKAMEAYRSERRASPHPRSPEALRALARWRGACCGSEYAEAFEVLRRIV
ncbi:MAG: PIG-L family deacetylase [Gemmatimonadetes bacterium]|nr:PIG-L family deacetylase [Gemmatimonadota bacterium]